jgi:hypothetical protein
MNNKMRYTRAISFDIAYKTLAYFYIDFRDVYEMPITKLTCDEFISKVKMDCAVIDVLGGNNIKDVSLIDRTVALHNCLTKIINKHNIGPDTLVLAEAQPESIKTFAGSKAPSARTVCDQLVMFFISRCDVELINPRKKNTVAFGGMDFDSVASIYYSGRRPNTIPPTDRTKIIKEHTTLNLALWMDMFKQSHLIDDIPRGKWNHIGDALMQLVWYVEQENN